MEGRQVCRILCLQESRCSLLALPSNRRQSTIGCGHFFSPWTVTHLTEGTLALWFP